MPQYLVANYLPDDFDPSTFPEAMFEEIHALNRELIAAGARKFACGLSPASSAKSLRTHQLRLCELKETRSHRKARRNG